MAWTGLRQAGAVGLNNGRCAGASTLLGQAARTLRDDQTYSASRKLGELFDASALALRLRHRRERDTFIANTLRFGHSGGAPLIGLRAASLTVFNREPKQLRLHEHALIAAMLLYPAQLHCGPATQNDIRRFNQQRNRARYGLVRAFEGDPRLAGELDALAKLAPITAPPPLPGLPERMACQANIHPLLRLGAVDPAAQRAMLRERESLNRLGIKASAYRLSFDRPEQAEFSRAIEQSRSQMAAQGGWIADPRSDEVVVLGFAARPDGKLSALYDSAANPQLFARRELGSLGKLAALAFLAERGWRPDQPLCNLAWGGRHNAGGNAGARTCDTPGARMTVSHAFGHSISLAVREALSHFPDAALRMRMTEWGFTVPSSSPASYNVAFGLAQASPAHLSAFTAALSRGLAGEPAIAAEPRVLVQYRDSFGKWRPVPQKGVVDLRGVFMTERGRAVVAEGAAAALLPGGTLHALGIKPPLSVAKSGTLDDEAKRVRFKAAAGAWRGSAWFAMVAPRTGPLGGPSIAMIPLATSVRHAMVQQPQRR
jgi:membrane peptidoglycan carboxypeptidase